MRLLWCQVRHCMSVRVSSSGRHLSHEGGVDLGAWTRDTHMADQLMRHATGGTTGLAGIMSHARGHRMTGRWVLHPARMRREGRRHAGHHLRKCRLSTAWISTKLAPRYRIRRLTGVFGVSEASWAGSRTLLVRSARRKSISGGRESRRSSTRCCKANATIAQLSRREGRGKGNPVAQKGR